MAQDLAIRDALLVKSVFDSVKLIEIKALAALQSEVSERLAKEGRGIGFPKRSTRSYAELYETAMELSFLTGLVHLGKLEEEARRGLMLEDFSFNLPFDEAIEFMKSLVPIPKEEYEELSADLKFRAFTIARVSQEDLINRIKELYLKKLKEGLTRSETLQALDEILAKAGISSSNPWWLEVHYRNNTMTTYNAGRWTQIKRSDTVKFLMYNAILDERTTELCRKLHGTIKPVDDPFWNKFYPPNHHNCRSVVTPISKTQLKTRGLRVSKIKTSDIYENPELRKQHQFTGHPASALSGVPKSLAERADKYKLWNEIFNFFERAMGKKFWRRLIERAKKASLSKEAERHIKVRHPEVYERYRQEFEKILQNPEEVWLMPFKEKGEVKWSLGLLKWLVKKEKAIIISLRKGKVRTADEYTYERLKEKMEKYGARRLE